MQFIRRVAERLNPKPVDLNLGNSFIQKATTPSDINEHMSSLLKYAAKCTHITECGVRSVVSSYAFAVGLRNKPSNKLVQVDLEWHPNLAIFKQQCMREGVNVVFYQQSDLECPIEETELLFIDTWHVYAQLKRELDRWNPHVTKYIILHDTTVDEWDGESIRMGMDMAEQARTTGYPEEEIRKGLWPAVEEFLADHPEWKLKERFTNNNGLTILERV